MYKTISSQSEPLHPVEFKKIWALSWFQMADLLGRDPRTLLRYGQKPTTKSYVKPDACVQILCGTIHKLWLLEGKQPVTTLK